MLLFYAICCISHVDVRVTDFHLTVNTFQAGGYCFWARGLSVCGSVVFGSLHPLKSFFDWKSAANGLIFFKYRPHTTFQFRERIRSLCLALQLVFVFDD